MPAVAPFSNHLPVRIKFGDGVARELGTIVAAEGAETAVVIVDAGLEDQSPAVAAAIATIEAAGVELVRHIKEAGEPTHNAVDVAAEVIRAADAGVLVAIGGGSVLDTAKAARLCLQQNMAFSDFLQSDRTYEEPVLPLIAVPTTAGTGSEVSGGAVVTDEATERKAGIAHPTLRAQYALVDPELTYSVPPKITAYTGIDALAQAVAGMIAKCRTPIGDGIALEATTLIGGSLVRAYRDGSDHDARSAMACGSMMAGLTMNLSDCAAEHSLAQAIGGEFHAPHGLTIGLVFAEVLEREAELVPEQLERVADALGVSDDGSGDGSRTVRAVREMLRELDFPVLSSLGVTDEDLDRLTALAKADYFITQAPVPWTDDEIRAAFSRALAMENR
jgi:alcohol dehydrogenase